MPRRYGDMPRHLGEYQRLCPHTDVWELVTKLKNKIVRPDPSSL